MSKRKLDEYRTVSSGGEALSDASLAGQPSKRCKQTVASDARNGDDSCLDSLDTAASNSNNKRLRVVPPDPRGRFQPLSDDLVLNILMFDDTVGLLSCCKAWSSLKFVTRAARLRLVQLGRESWPWTSAHDTMSELSAGQRISWLKVLSVTAHSPCVTSIVRHYQFTWRDAVPLPLVNDWPETWATSADPSTGAMRGLPARLLAACASGSRALAKYTYPQGLLEFNGLFVNSVVRVARDGRAQSAAILLATSMASGSLPMVEWIVDQMGRYYRLRLLVDYEAAILRLAPPRRFLSRALSCQDALNLFHACDLPVESSIRFMTAPYSGDWSRTEDTVESKCADQAEPRESHAELASCWRSLISRCARPGWELYKKEIVIMASSMQLGQDHHHRPWPLIEALLDSASDFARFEIQRDMEFNNTAQHVVFKETVHFGMDRQQETSFLYHFIASLIPQMLRSSDDLRFLALFLRQGRPWLTDHVVIRGNLWHPGTQLPGHERRISGLQTLMCEILRSNIQRRHAALDVLYSHLCSYAEPKHVAAFRSYEKSLGMDNE